LLNSLNDDIRHHASAIGWHYFQCLLDVFRILLVPLSGPIRSSPLLSTCLPWSKASRHAFFVASNSAWTTTAAPPRHHPLAPTVSIPPDRHFTGYQVSSAFGWGPMVGKVISIAINSPTDLSLLQLGQTRSPTSARSSGLPDPAIISASIPHTPLP